MTLEQVQKLSDEELNRKIRDVSGKWGHYTHDLSACHYIEKELKYRRSYVTTLCRAIGYECDSAEALEAACFASPRHRAEAFLFTKLNS